LKAHDEAKSRTGFDLALYGQEMDNATKALARMNTFLHNCPSADVWQDNILSSPHWVGNDGRLKTFDFVVANPPFSAKAWSNGFLPAQDEFHRFDFGIPPAKNGDYAFLLHVLACLKSTGHGAIILPHGVLFRGGAEAVIRRAIVGRGYIKSIIGLPANLFYGTGIPACIIVLDKERAHARKGIFMIDASKGFLKDGNKNRLRAQDIHRIVDTFTRQIEVPRYARMVPLDEIKDPKNNFNLNLPRHIDSTEPEDLQDIDAHLRGGIPDRDIDDLNRYWQVFPAVRAALFTQADGPGYIQLRVPVGEVKAAIFGHAEFTTFNTGVTALFAKWRKAPTPRLNGIKPGDHPKSLIETLSENLLDTFQKARLIDPYDVYQHLMDFWENTMQDDVYLISADGWLAGARVREIVQAKDKNGKMTWQEEHDYKKGKRRFKSDLIPSDILVARFYVAERDAIDDIVRELAEIERQFEELMDEQGGEDGLLAEVVERDGDKRKISTRAVKGRLREIATDADFADERQALEDYATLIGRQSSAKSHMKQALEELDEKLAVKYAELTEDEIKTLVVDDKWLSVLATDVQTELDRVSQALTGRIRQLAERYATPLPRLVDEVAALAARVDEHIRKMGFQP
jgi:type I restriction enzyme M protein